MEQDGQEPDMVTLKAFDRILTALSQAKQVSFNAKLALHPLLDASLHQLTGHSMLQLETPDKPLGPDDQHPDDQK